MVLDSWPPGPREGTSSVYAACQGMPCPSKQSDGLCKALSPFCLGKQNKQGNRESCFPDLLGPRCHVASDKCLLLSGLFPAGRRGHVLGDMCCSPTPAVPP